MEIWLNISRIFYQIEQATGNKFLNQGVCLKVKGPRPFKQQKNVFERLNNSPCNLIESNTLHGKKHDSGWSSVWIFV